MSKRKDQQSARDRVAKPMSVNEFVKRYREINAAAYMGGRGVFGDGADTVRSMFEKTDEFSGNRAGARFSFKDIDWSEDDGGRRWYWWDDLFDDEAPQPHQHRDYYSHRRWKSEPLAEGEQPFRVLYDGVVDLHPSQWRHI